VVVVISGVFAVEVADVDLSGVAGEGNGEGTGDCVGGDCPAGEDAAAVPFAAACAGCLEGKTNLDESDRAGAGGFAATGPVGLAAVSSGLPLASSGPSVGEVMFWRYLDR